MAAKKPHAPHKWAIQAFVWTLVLSVGVSAVSVGLLERASIYWAIVVLLILMLMGIFFDMIGVAATSADAKPFSAMASRRMPGALQALFLIKKAPIVSNFCNDIVGDICGIVSGSAGVSLALSLPWKNFWVPVIVGSLVAALTVGGKALAKHTAVRQSRDVLLMVGKMMWFFSQWTKGSKNGKS